MGIKGLKNLIRKYAPDAINPFDMNTLVGKRVAIDSSILLYKFRYLYTEPDFHIRGFKAKVEEFQRMGILPIFVFDGTPPDAKKHTLSKRNDTKNKMKDRLVALEESLSECPEIPNVDEFIDSGSESDTDVEVKKIKKIKSEITKIKKNLLYVHKFHSTEVILFLKSIGIPFFESSGEAEETCVALQKSGRVDYILTEDTDSLAFGGTNILFNNGTEHVSLDLVLQGFGISMDSFIDLCILCGCDYTCTIPRVGPVTAYRKIKELGSIEAAFETIPENFNYILSRELFKQNDSFDLN